MKKNIKYFAVVLLSLIIITSTFLCIIYIKYIRLQKNIDEYVENSKKISKIEVLDSTSGYCNFKYNNEKVSIKLDNCNASIYYIYTGIDSLQIYSGNELYTFIDKYNDKYYFYTVVVDFETGLNKTDIYSYDVNTESFSKINNNTMEETFQDKAGITPHFIEDIFMSGENIYFGIRFDSKNKDGFEHVLYYLNINNNNLDILIEPGDYEEFTLNPSKTKIYYIQNNKKIIEYSLLDNTKTTIFRNKDIFRFKFLNEYQIAIDTQGQTYIYNTISEKIDKTDEEYFKFFPNVKRID